MRILFDENLNRRLKRFSHEGFEVMTVPERGWSGKRHGELLRLAEKEFDSENLTGLELAPLMDGAVASLAHVAPGSVTHIPAT